MTETETHFTQSTSSLVVLTAGEYRRRRRHQAAGPVSELLLSATRDRYAEIGANAWTIENDRGATVLRPVHVEGMNRWD